VLIKACLNGSRRPGDHEALPVTAGQLAADAGRAVAAGAGALHVHPRGADGVETLDPEACAQTLQAIRRSCPGVPVGLSTATWIEADPARRDRIRAWYERPDFVSVNCSEPGFVEMCELLHGIGIGIEAGVWTVADVGALLESGQAHRLVRVLVEPPDPDPVRADAEATVITAALDHAGITGPRVYHGSGIATWRVIEHAAEQGWDVRVGLEDTLQLPDGSRAADNAELVGVAAEIVRRRRPPGR
jgi:uncharacterized protein (DUF849 family)